MSTVLQGPAFVEKGNAGRTAEPELRLGFPQRSAEMREVKANGLRGDECGGPGRFYFGRGKRRVTGVDRRPQFVEREFAIVVFAKCRPDDISKLSQAQISGVEQRVGVTTQPLTNACERLRAYEDLESALIHD